MATSKNTAPIQFPRNKDLKLLVRFRSQRGTSTSSSSKVNEPEVNEPEEFYSPTPEPKPEGAELMFIIPSQPLELPG